MECCKNYLEMVPTPKIEIHFTQFMLFNINLVFAAAGTLLLMMSYAAHWVSVRYMMFLQLDYFDPTVFLIVFGTIMMITSMSGGIATIKRSTSVVNIYIILLIILLIVEITAAMTTFFTQSNIHSRIHSNLVKTLNNETDWSWNDVIDRWDYMQDYLHCCGVHSSKDWAPLNVDGPKIEAHDGSVYTVPSSCCVHFYDKCHSGITCNGAPSKGCVNVWSRYVSHSITILGYITLTTGISQFLGLVFAFSLSRNIRLLNSEEEMQRQELQHLIYADLHTHKPAEEKPLLSSSSNA